MAKRLRCYLRLHRWRRVKAPDGDSWYHECRDCGETREIPDTLTMNGGEAR
jgi:hypothetical protein